MGLPLPNGKTCVQETELVPVLFDQWCSDTVLIRSIYLEVFQNPLDVWSLDVNAVEPHYKQIDGAQKICCEMKKRRQHAKFVGAQASSS